MYLVLNVNRSTLAIPFLKTVDSCLSEPKIRLQVPLIGRWSDRYGRRPFLALFLTVAVVPPLLMAAHVNYGLSLYYYFPAQVSAKYILYYTIM